MLEHDFLFRRAKLVAGASERSLEGCVIAARKRTRRLLDVVDETFAALSGHCETIHASVREWCQNFPPGI